MNVSFRKLGINDADRMLSWVSADDVRQNLGLRSKPTREATVEWITKANSSMQLEAHAICLDSRHVGNVILDKIDVQIQTARFSIYLGDVATRGCGVGTESTKFALELAFKTLGLEKLWLTVHTENEPAIKCYFGCGFQIEGTHRKEFLKGDRIVDCHYMGILRSEWNTSC